MLHGYSRQRSTIGSFSAIAGLFVRDDTQRNWRDPVGVDWPLTTRHSLDQAVSWKELLILRLFVFRQVPSAWRHPWECSLPMCEFRHRPNVDSDCAPWNHQQAWSACMRYY